MARLRLPSTQTVETELSGGEGRAGRQPPLALETKMGDGRNVGGRATSSPPQRMGTFQSRPEAIRGQGPKTESHGCLPA